jgi:fatty-acyl-CoA synthase
MPGDDQPQLPAHARPPYLTLGGLVWRAAERYGSRIAFVDMAGGRRSFADLGQRAARLANALIAHGLRPGDRVAVYLDDTVDAPEVYGGISMAGCIAVHTSYLMPGPELALQLADSTARGIVYSAAKADVVEEVVRGTDTSVLIAVGPQRCQGLRYEDVVSTGPALPPVVDRAPEELAMLAYTSGTTGRRKGAMISNRALFAGVRTMVAAFRIAPGSRMSYMASVSFSATLVTEVFTHIYVGGTLHMLAKDRSQWLETMLRERTTCTNVSSPMIPQFLEHVRANPSLLGHLNAVYHGGSPAPREQMADLVETVGWRYVETWGMTEAVGAITATTIADHGPYCEADDIVRSVGRPLPTARVWVEDENGAACGANTTGELIIDLDTLVSGYWQDEEKTKLAFRDGYFRTGDRGYLDSAGYVYLTGRKSDLIISGGANVYPAEVESALIGMPGLAGISVFGVPDERWGEAVAAAVVATPGSRLTQDEVRAYARERLAAYKIPKAVFVVDELPLNASQKVDRKVLAERFRGSA